MNVPVGPGGAPRRRRSDPSCAFAAAAAIVAVAVILGTFTAFAATPPPVTVPGCTAHVWHQVRSHTDPGPFSLIPECDGLDDTQQAHVWATIGELQEAQQ